MSVPLRHADLEPRYSAFDADDRYEDAFALSPHERIGGSPVSDTSNALAWSASLAIILCAGWVLINDPASLLESVSDVAHHAAAIADQTGGASKSPAIETASTTAPPTSVPYTGVPSVAAPPAPQSAQPPNPAPAKSTTLPPPASAPPEPANGSHAAASTPEADDADKQTASHETETASVDKADAADDAYDTASDPPVSKETRHDAATSDMPPAKLERPEPHGPLETRAEAVGLHPGLSHAVLARFSGKDFSNARKAIDTAIARTPDNGVFIWPRRRQPGRALFRVHFVAGAARDCRRYVVTVTMNGWTTTALPMEKCGVRSVTARR